jgi:hypothetical protein
MTGIDRSHASVVLLLRIGALAIAVWGLRPPGSVGDHDGLSLAQAVALELVAVAVIEALALGLWWFAPRLARGVTRAVRPGAPASVDVAATAFVALGLWFAGVAVVGLMTLPAHALVLKLIAQSGGHANDYADRNVIAFLPKIVEEGVHLAFGVALLRNAKRLSAWLARRTG